MTPVRLIAEGDTDYALAEGVCPRFKPRTSGKGVGRDDAIRAAGIFARSSKDARIVFLLDRNGHPEPTCRDEVDKKLKEVAPDLRTEGNWWRTGSSGIRLVLAGLPEDPLLLDLGIHKYTSDDYLLRLFLEETSFQTFVRGEGHLAYTPPNAGALLVTLRDAASHLKDREVVIDTSKRYVHLVRAILGFEASRAIMMQHMIERCPDATKATYLGTLLADLSADPPF